MKIFKYWLEILMIAMSTALFYGAIVLRKEIPQIDDLCTLMQFICAAAFVGAFFSIANQRRAAVAVHTTRIWRE